MSLLDSMTTKLEYGNDDHHGCDHLFSMTGDSRAIIYQGWPRRSDRMDEVERRVQHARKMSLINGEAFLGSSGFRDTFSVGS